MILLLMFLGFVLVYLVAFMAVITMFLAFCTSLLFSGLVYGALYVWSALRHRTTPEWTFDKKPWTPDIDDMQGWALGAGIISLGYLAVGLVAYAVSGSGETTVNVLVGFTVILGLVALTDPDRRAKAAEEDPPSSPDSAPAKGRDRFHS